MESSLCGGQYWKGILSNFPNADTKLRDTPQNRHSLIQRWPHRDNFPNTDTKGTDPSVYIDILRCLYINFLTGVHIVEIQLQGD